MQHIWITWGLSLLGGLAVSLLPATANDSVYTKLNLEDECAILMPFDETEPGSGVAWVCRGFRGIGVFVAEGDLRFTVTPLVEGLPTLSDGSLTYPDFETLPGFNRINDTLEWRLDATGDPIATILRWFEDTGDGSGAERQYLIVTRALPGGQCHVARVNANTVSKANQVARDIADTQSAAFRCGVDQVQIIE